MIVVFLVVLCCDR